MAYEKGEAYIGNDYYDTRRPSIALPHSCDEWVIGTAKEAQDLIDDLKELIPKLPAESE